MHQMGRDVPVVVVAVTDGEAASATWFEPGLAATRREEQRTALSILGVAVAATVRLGLPDGAVAAHGETLVELLLAIVQPGDVVVAPWARDLHPDHVACGRAAQYVARARCCALVGSMFWALHHIDPRDHPDIGFAALVLTDDECLWRREALHSHASQFDHGTLPPILDESLLDPLRLPIERYVVTS